MLKQEFEKLVGHSVSEGCYEKIEAVYMESEKDFDKESLISLYKEKDMNGIEQEYKEVLKNREIENLKRQLTKEKERVSKLVNKLAVARMALKKVSCALEDD